MKANEEARDGRRRKLYGGKRHEGAPTNNRCKTRGEILRLIADARQELACRGEGVERIVGSARKRIARRGLAQQLLSALSFVARDGLDVGSPSMLGKA